MVQYKRKIPHPMSGFHFRAYISRLRPRTRAQPLCNGRIVRSDAPGALHPVVRWCGFRSLSTGNASRERPPSYRECVPRDKIGRAANRHQRARSSPLERYRWLRCMTRQHLCVLFPHGCSQMQTSRTKQSPRQKAYIPSNYNKVDAVPEKCGGSWRERWAHPPPPRPSHLLRLTPLDMLRCRLHSTKKGVGRLRTTNGGCQNSPPSRRLVVQEFRVSTFLVFTTQQRKPKQTRAPCVSEPSAS